MSEINKLFSLMNVDFNAVASAMLESMIENAKGQFPDIPTSVWDKYRKNLGAESLRNLYADIYVRHYSQNEIAGLVKFYESPLGRKSVKANLQITQESQVISETYFEALGGQIMKELHADDW